MPPCDESRILTETELNPSQTGRKLQTDCHTVFAAILLGATFAVGEELEGDMTNRGNIGFMLDKQVFQEV